MSDLVVLGVAVGPIVLLLVGLATVGMLVAWVVTKVLGRKG